MYVSNYNHLILQYCQGNLMEMSQNCHYLKRLSFVCECAMNAHIAQNAHAHTYMIIDMCILS